MAAGRVASPARSTSPTRSHPLLMPRARRAGVTISRPRLPRPSRAHARGDPARLRATWRRGTRAARRPSSTISRFTAGESRAPSRRAARSHRHLLARRAPLDAARRARAARARSCSWARSSRERTSARCSARTRSSVTCARRSRRSGSRAARPQASAPWLRAIAKPPLEGHVTHLGYVAPRAALRSLRAGVDAGAALSPRRLRDARARSDDRRRAGRSSAGAARCRRSPGDAGADGRAGRSSRGSPRRCGATSTIPARRRPPRNAGVRARACTPGTRARTTLLAAYRARRASARMIDDPASLTIGIDARELLGEPTGVGRYLGELLRRWTARSTPRRGGLVLYTPESLPFLQTVPDTADVREVVVGSGRGTWWEQTHLRRAVRADPPDVFFAGAYTAPLALGVPLAVTIHDVSFAAHPEWFRPREGARRRLLTRQAARAAERRLHRLGVLARARSWSGSRSPPDRVRVIAPGVTRPAPAGPRPREPLVLFVGSIFNRRRLPTLITAFAAATADASRGAAGDRRGRSQLPGAGPGAGSPRRPASAARVEIRHYVTEAELESLYARAVVFVFLSEYEGFGLTPLEALSAGVPIVVLDTPIAREVYGDAAWYVPPTATSRGAADGDPHAPRRSGERRADAGGRARRAGAVLVGRRGGADAGRASNGIVPPSERAVDRHRQLQRARGSRRRACGRCAKRPPAIDHEIVVVDNASTDGSAEAARGVAGVRVIALGRNAGFCRREQRRDPREPRASCCCCSTATRSCRPARSTAWSSGCSPRPTRAVAGPRLVDADGRAGAVVRPDDLAAERVPAEDARARTDATVADRARRRATAREQFVDWVSGACLLVRRADAEAVGPARRALLPVHRGRRLLRRDPASGAAGSCSRRPPQITHLRGRSRGRRARGGAGGLPAEPPRLLREAPSALGAAAARSVLCGSRGDCSRLRRAPNLTERDLAKTLPVRIAIDARKLRDYGIGTYVRNLLRQLARQDHDDRVRRALPRRATATRSRSWARTSARSSRRPAPIRSRSSSRPAGAPARGRRALPRAALRPAAADPVPRGRHDPRLHPPAVSAVPAEPAGVRLRPAAHVDGDAPGGARHHGLGEPRSATSCATSACPSRRIDVIYNAIDDRFWQPPDADDMERVRERYRLTEPFVLYAGNIKPHKNLERLIEAFHLMRQDAGTRDVQLLIIGDEISKYATLRRAVHRHKLHKHVRFFGFVSRPDAGRALPARRRLRVPVALRGLRAAAARGDGERHAGHHLERVVAAGGRRRRRAPDRSVRAGGDRRRHAARADDADLRACSSAAAWPARVSSPGSARSSACARSTTRSSGG